MNDSWMDSQVNKPHKTFIKKNNRDRTAIGKPWVYHWRYSDAWFPLLMFCTEAKFSHRCSPPYEMLVDHYSVFINVISTFKISFPGPSTQQ